MRDTASLSGVMLKLPIVWWISWGFVRDAYSGEAEMAHSCGIFVEKHSGRYLR